MRIELNGEETVIDEATTLAQLLEQQGYGPRRIAVEVNEEVVPRSRFAEHRLSSHDRVEIIHAIGGG